MSRAQVPALAALAGALVAAGALAARPGAGAASTGVNGLPVQPHAAAATGGAAVVPRVATARARAAAGGGQREPDQPPPAHTGGFGEPTCQACHFEDDVNAGSGSLALDVPAPIASGATVRLTIRLAHQKMRRAGFMLSARTVDGAQAGALHAVDERVQVTVADGVAYAHHTFAGTDVAGDTMAWVVEWEATGLAAGDVVHLHFVGNAANDDASPFGDFIYAGSRELVVSGQ